MSVLVATAAAIGVVWLLLPDRGRSRLRRLSGDPADGTTARWGRLGLTSAIAAGSLLLVPVLRSEPHLIVVAATVAGLVGAGLILVRRSRRRARHGILRGEVVGICDALVAELRAGQPPGRALTWVARSWPDLEHASRLARLGGDIPAAMRHMARRPGAEPMAQIAAGWEVAHRSGAGLADVLDRLSRSLRDDEDVRREVSAALGPTRATGRLLAMLPLFGLGLGFAMGADPLGVLLGSTLGSLCLAFGGALAVAGLLWVERIADRAEPC